jgi:hypothetical protein
LLLEKKISRFERKLFGAIIIFVSKTNVLNFWGTKVDPGVQDKGFVD